MAFDMLDAIISVSNPTSDEKVKIRIGTSFKISRFIRL